ncbi:MAG: hypothetical protein IPK60_09280 [Sandaracinaceae bacterium]|nr:hypothetical protein [Sandaracinaceae bacterium]
MMNIMNERTLVLFGTLYLLVGCGHSATPDRVACGEEYVRATIAIPGHESKEYCLPNAVFRNQVEHQGPFCHTSGGSLTEGSIESVRIEVAGGGPWFTRREVNPAGGFGFAATAGVEVPDDFCGPDAARCIYENRATCSFEITQPARADGEIVEGHLTAPCDLNGGSHFGEPFFPTVTAADFRAHVVTIVDTSPDAGIPCMYFPDLGPP